MKRIILALSLFMIPLGLFAGLELGPTATLKFPFAVNDGLSEFSGLGIEDFVFGADVELKLGLFQLGALLDFRFGRTVDTQMMPAAVTALVTGGLLFDLRIVRLGIGAGPTFIFDIKDKDAIPVTPPPGEEQPGDIGVGLSVKAIADVVLGRIVLRVNAISTLDVVRMAAAGDALEYMDMKVGLSLLFKL